MAYRRAEEKGRHKIRSKRGSSKTSQREPSEGVAVVREPVPEIEAIQSWEGSTSYILVVISSQVCDAA